MSQFRNTTGGKTDELMKTFYSRNGTDQGMNWRTEVMRDELTGSGLSFGGRSFFKSTGATAAYQVPRGSIRASDEFYARIAEQDRIANLKRFGGYSSRKAQSEAGKRISSEDAIDAQLFMRNFGGSLGRYYGKSGLRSQLNKLRTSRTTIQESLTSAGLGYISLVNRATYTNKIRPSQIAQYNRDLAEAISYNNNQYAKAGQINLLEQGFGATGFVGSALSLPSLQDEVARQDALMKSIGLDRTEAFQIVDTAGRGREEIDDRVRFKDRLSSMSTGVSVL